MFPRQFWEQNTGCGAYPGRIFINNTRSGSLFFETLDAGAANQKFARGGFIPYILRPI
jgi:hypothetical protein